jgi:excinuclease ABC subunit C
MRNAQNEKVQNALSTLPDSPGVYIFRDEEGTIIYIGKALNLKSRVKSYWLDTAPRERPKLAVLMPKVADVNVIVTNSEKEALLLEANLVRQHMPRYNVTLKDDKRYPWLAITYDVAYPRLIMVRDPQKYKKENPKSRVFGPYVETGMMWDTVRILRKVFPMRQRKSPLFKDRPCMNYYIGLCLGPCQNLVAEPEYLEMVAQVELFLAGRQTEVMSQLKQQMEAASENLEYEKAAKIRDRLRALETVIEKQQVFFKDKKVSQDIIAEAHANKLIAICIMRVREGKLTSSETVCLPLTDRTSWDEAYQSFIDLYYTSVEDVSVPQEVMLQHQVEDAAALSDVLSAKSKYSVRVGIPQRGGKVKMIEMAKKNAELALEKEITEKQEADAKVVRLIAHLQEELGTVKPPRRIECFDISNIQGTDNVASMVVFEDGQPKKSDYRRFKIRGVEGVANDFASMKEVVGRRYSRLQKEQKPFPDLIIIDGGKGQLNAALEALAELNIKDIDIIGLAKKQEEVYKPGNSSPLLISRRSEALHVLQRTRDEAHRFAITFHRKLRAKRSLMSGLDLLPGVGASRRKLLIQHFGTFEKVKEATLEELKAVPGLPKNVAASIFNALSAGAKDKKMSADAAGDGGDDETIGFIEDESEDSNEISDSLPEGDEAYNAVDEGNLKVAEADFQD